MGFTEEQAAAIRDEHPFVSLVAPAGSGKTHTVAGKVREIRNQHSDHRGSAVAALTFTNKAAGELHERTEGGAECSTFHGFAIRVRELGDSSPFTIYDERDQQDVAVQVGRELGIVPPGKISDFRRAAEKVIGRDDSGKPRNPAGLARYRTILRRSRAVDFDMLIEDAMKIATETPLAREAFSSHHFMLDEQQDADPVQWALVNACDPQAIFMVGDPRQTIYTWRNADPRILLSRWCNPSPPFGVVAEYPEGMFSGVTLREGPPKPLPDPRFWHAHALTACFRSKAEIVALANKVAAGMRGFDTPPMVAHREGGADVAALGFQTFDQECEHIARWAAERAQGWTPDRERPAVMILARSWRRLKKVRELLEARSVAHEYLADSGQFWSYEPAKNAARHLALCCNPASDWIARQLVGWPFNTTSGRELLEAQTIAAREAEPLAFVLGRMFPDRFGYWRPDLMAEIAAMDDAGAAMDKWLHLRAKVIAKLKHAMRTRHLSTVQQAIQRCEKWTEGARAQGLPTSPQAFSRWLAFRQNVDEAQPAPIWLSTVHGVKGLEADHVAVTGLHAGKGFDDEPGADEWDGEGPPPNESRRLFFVAATRARDGLLCTFTRTTKGREKWPRSPGAYWREAHEVFGGADEVEELAAATGADEGGLRRDVDLHAAAFGPRPVSDFMTAELEKLRKG